MKKLMAVLLAAAMLLMSFPALADGSKTDKAITFLDFSYGDTFSSIRSSERIYSIYFKTEMLSPRNLAEAFWRLAEWSQVSNTLPVCFDASISGRSVAGHWCNTSLYFVYPVENGSPVISEADATFYAGVYEFQDGDAKAIFDDLKQKLTTLYGEPYSEGSDLSSALGEATVPEDRQQEYAEQLDRCNPVYVVWVSSANNAALVLKHYQEGDNFSRTKLDYISLDAAAIFGQIDAAQDSSDSSNFEGL